jgi:hypothetical protein
MFSSSIGLPFGLGSQLWTTSIVLTSALNLVYSAGADKLATDGQHAVSWARKAGSSRKRSTEPTARCELREARAWTLAMTPRWTGVCRGGTGYVPPPTPTVAEAAAPVAASPVLGSSRAATASAARRPPMPRPRAPAGSTRFVIIIDPPGSS